MDFNGFIGVLNYMGLGSFFVGAGALIQTGVTIHYNFGAVAAFGAGFYTGCADGLLVQTGVTLSTTSGVSYLVSLKRKSPRTQRDKVYNNML